jgi:hypothetical protein
VHAASGCRALRTCIVLLGVLVCGQLLSSKYIKPPVVNASYIVHKCFLKLDKNTKRPTYT